MNVSAVVKGRGAPPHIRMPASRLTMNIDRHAQGEGNTLFHRGTMGPEEKYVRDRDSI